MNEVINDDVEELSQEMFFSALKMVAKKHPNKYKFLLKAGKSLLDAVYNLFSIVWKHEILPEGWSDSLLIQLYKGKGSKSNLDNIRHIHIKEEIPKLFGQIVL